MRSIFIQLIRFYRYCISPYTVPSCRYHPTCSEYAVEALQTHGALKGSYLGVMRILRCHPFAKGGYDPVPDKPSSDQTEQCHCHHKGSHRG